jgi:hypothetical protein
VDQFRWEKLSGLESRQGIIDIHRSFKFKPAIIAKGQETEAICTAFMRRKLSDWEQAEQLTSHYSRQQVVQFSPNPPSELQGSSGP